MTSSDALTPEQKRALVEMATTNVAADPILYKEGRALAFAAVNQYRRAHAALELALADFAAEEPPRAIEAMPTSGFTLGSATVS